MGVENELVRIVKCKRKPDEPRQQFLQRLVETALAIPDETWDTLTDAAQRWVNAGSKALNRGRDVKDFEAGSLSKGKEENVKPKKKASPAKAKGDGKKKAPAKKVQGKSSGAQAMIKRLVAHNPEISTDAIMDKLAKAGFDPTPFAVSTIKSGMRNSMKILREEGLLAKSVNI